MRILLFLFLGGCSYFSHTRVYRQCVLLSHVFIDALTSAMVLHGIKIFLHSPAHTGQANRLCTQAREPNPGVALHTMHTDN